MKKYGLLGARSSQCFNRAACSTHGRAGSAGWRLQTSGRCLILSMKKRQQVRDPCRRFSVFNERLVKAMSDLRERFRLTANVVSVVGPDEPLPKLPVARAVWEPAPDFATSTECWMLAGAAHHTVMDTASGPEAWADLAEIARMELAVRKPR